MYARVILKVICLYPASNNVPTYECCKDCTRIIRTKTTGVYTHSPSNYPEAIEKQNTLFY